MIVRLGVAALLLAVLVSLAACDAALPAPSAPSPPPGVPQTLAGTSWVVVNVDGRPPVAGHIPSIRFDADSVTGNGGCNGVGGHYRFEPATGRFAVADFAGTLIGCGQLGVTDHESAFMTALAGATSAVLDRAGQLVLRGPVSTVTLAEGVPARR